MFPCAHFGPCSEGLRHGVSSEKEVSAHSPQQSMIGSFHGIEIVHLQGTQGRNVHLEEGLRWDAMHIGGVESVDTLNNKNMFVRQSKGVAWPLAHPALEAVHWGHDRFAAGQSDDVSIRQSDIHGLYVVVVDVSSIPSNFVLGLVGELQIVVIHRQRLGFIPKILEVNGQFVRKRGLARRRRSRYTQHSDFALSLGNATCNFTQLLLLAELALKY